MSPALPRMLLACSLLHSPALARDEAPPVVPAKKDLHGDPLPHGAVSRLGSLRLRHAGTVCALAFTPDGKTLASAGADLVIRLWDPATGREKAHLAGHTEEVRSLAITPDGKTLVSAGLDHKVRIWDL